MTSDDDCTNFHEKYRLTWRFLCTWWCLLLFQPSGGSTPRTNGSTSAVNDAGIDIKLNPANDQEEEGKFKQNWTKVFVLKLHRLILSYKRWCASRTCRRTRIIVAIALP